MSRDRLTDQYSSYNAMPFRNLNQINELKQRSSVVYYGEGSDAHNRPEHKVHRNSFMRKLVYDFAGQLDESVPFGWTGDGAKVKVS